MNSPHNRSLTHDVAGTGEIWDLYIPLKGFTVKELELQKNTCLPMCILDELLSYAYHPEEEDKDSEKVVKWSLQTMILIWSSNKQYLHYAVKFLWNSQRGYKWDVSPPSQILRKKYFDDYILEKLQLKGKTVETEVENTIIETVETSVENTIIGAVETEVENNEIATTEAGNTIIGTVETEVENNGIATTEAGNTIVKIDIENNEVIETEVNIVTAKPSMEQLIASEIENADW